jgi:hypothetical protein
MLKNRKLIAIALILLLLAYAAKSILNTLHHFGNHLKAFVSDPAYPTLLKISIPLFSFVLFLIAGFLFWRVVFCKDSFRQTFRLLMRKISADFPSELISCFKEFDSVYIYPISFFLLVMFFFYVSYAFKAYFHQDDFGLLNHYKNSLRAYDAINIFGHAVQGRVLATNFYWNPLYRFFGYRSEMYFFTNLSIICLNSFLAYLFFKEFTKKTFCGISAMVIYFIGLPTIHNYYWICNVNYLYVHGFIFLFLYLTLCKSFMRTGIVKPSIVFIVFLLGMYSNFMMAFCLSILVIYFINEIGERPSYFGTFLILAMFVVSYYFFLASPNEKNGPYETAFTLAQFKLGYQFYLTRVFAIVPSLLIVCVWVVIFIYSLYRNKTPLFYILVSSFIFFLPFTFLKYHMYINYFALPLVFFSVGISYVIEKLKILYVFYVVFLLYSSSSDIHKFINKPAGAAQKVFFEELNKVLPQGIHSLCIKGRDMTYNPIYGPPYYWWSFGFENGFKLMVNPYLEYKIYDENKCKGDFIVEIDENDYTIQRTYTLSESQANQEFPEAHGQTPQPLAK